MNHTTSWTPLESPLSGFDALLGRPEVRVIDNGAQMRVQVGPERANAMGGLHGAFLASIAEQSLGLAFSLQGKIAFCRILTIDLSLQYFGQADISKPIVVTALVTRETRRLAFVRGEISQDDTPFVSFWSTLRKLDQA